MKRTQNQAEQIKRARRFRLIAIPLLALILLLALVLFKKLYLDKPSSYEKNGKVLQASVTLHTAICPECGRAYVSGGETRTAIQYKNESNPYQKNLKSMQADAFRGANVDLAV